MFAKEVLVLGASGDLGVAICERLARRGYGVLVAARNPEAVALSFEPLERLELDVVHSARMTSAIEQLAERSANFFALVYCPGVVRDGPVARHIAEEWSETINVNLIGAAAAIKAVSRRMMLERTGRIVLLGSASARRPVPGQAAYASSKLALEALCRTTAIELGRFGISCNVVAPGAIESQMFRKVREDVVERTIRSTPLRKLGEPRHVSAAVEFLLSEDADFVTGQTLVVDGGLSVG